MAAPGDPDGSGGDHDTTAPDGATSGPDTLYPLAVDLVRYEMIDLAGGTIRADLVATSFWVTVRG